MKTIVSVNTAIPTVEQHLEYLAGHSLRDYEIIVFDPALPYQHRIEFTAGGSCVDIDGTRTLVKAMQHWQDELTSALAAGKTVFVLLNEFEEDRGATGAETKARAQNYSTMNFNNYHAIPVSLKLRNTRGKRMVTVNGRHKAYLDALGDLAGYKVVMDGNVGDAMLATNDGATVGSVARAKGLPGHIVFLPHFDFAEYDRSRGATWSKKAMQRSAAITAQLLAIDRSLTQTGDATPEPAWMASHPVPSAVAAHSDEISRIDAKVTKLEADKEAQLEARRQVMSHTRLLYETGKQLESAVERALIVLGFSVENYRNGDLEIDHVIVGPSGVRMIGESEGKDTSAIDISKFRQLESNIQEDFQRDGVEVHAKGVLFGNGFRLTEPGQRKEQFTTKCFTNAKRLSTALVHTSDLYAAVVYSLDYPADEDFKKGCRDAIENTNGEVVAFPKGASRA